MKYTFTWWQPLFSGVCIGGLGVTPGVSGGAVAASFGYYEPLLYAAAHPIKALKQSAKTLVPLCLGIAVGIVLLGRALLRLFAAAPEAARCAVAGLILGTLLCSAKEVFCSCVLRQSLLSAAALGVGFTLFYGHVFPTVGTVPTFVEWLLCGGVYALGTVVPGVSASCILLSMNAYEQVLTLMAGENLTALFPFSIGFCGASALLICIVNCLYTRHKSAASALIFGFVTASIFPVIPPLSVDKTGIVAVWCGLIGVALAFAAEKRIQCKAK